MGRFVRGKDLRAGTLKAPTTFGDTQGGAILADSITSIGDITVIAGNITADLVIANIFQGDGGQLSNIAGGTPGGLNTEIQFNNSGSFGGTANLTYDDTFGVTSQFGFTTSANITANNVSITTDLSTYTITASGNIDGGNLITVGIVSATGNVTGGNITTSGDVDATGNVTGAYILGDGSQLTNLPSGGNTSPGGSDTYVQFNDGGSFGGDSGMTYDKTTDTLTIAGDISALSGNVDADSFNFTTLVFGSGNVLAGNLNTFESGNVVAGNLVTTGNVYGNVNGYDIGYKDIPQISLTGNVTLAATDPGKHYYSTQATEYTLTIPPTANVSIDVGAAINIINRGTANINITRGSGVSLYQAGNTTSADRILTSYGAVTLQKVESDVWFLVGVGVI